MELAIRQFVWLLASSWYQHFALLIVPLIVVIPLETILHADSSQTLLNRWFDLRYAAVVAVLNLFIGTALFGSIAHIYELAGGPLLKNGLCDLGVLANFIYLFLFLAILDFFGYWFHRIQHASSTIWCLHQLHHTDECMNVATALRNHWLDTPLQVLMVVSPLCSFFRSLGLPFHSNGRFRWPLNSLSTRISNCIWDHSLRS
jgi:sterol desaturase/sphingolipid hydroxylase (fatty acid hydroxylase superfamily)